MNTTSLKPSLVILAAGMGSRFGGLKQMTPVDDAGNFLLDYSIYDALRAGFGRVVCVISRAMEESFLEIVAARAGKHIEIRTAIQDIAMLPEGVVIPPERVKPWGTAHALLCAKEAVQDPFALINADDYYGPHAYAAIHAFLSAPRTPGAYAMVAYPVEHTLTENGTVSRGVCKAEHGELAHIEEIAGIRMEGSGGAYERQGKVYPLPAGTPVSMNFWGFDSGIFTHLEQGFPAFLERGLAEDPLRCEYQLPTQVQLLMHAGEASVAMLQSTDRWYGVTHKADHAGLVEALHTMRQAGLYPEPLWEL